MLLRIIVFIFLPTLLFGQESSIQVTNFKYEVSESLNSLDISFEITSQNQIDIAYVIFDDQDSTNLIFNNGIASTRLQLDGIISNIHEKNIPIFINDIIGNVFSDTLSISLDPKYFIALSDSLYPENEAVIDANENYVLTGNKIYINEDPFLGTYFDELYLYESGTTKKRTIAIPETTFNGTLAFQHRATSLNSYSGTPKLFGDNIIGVMGKFERMGFVDLWLLNINITTSEYDTLANARMLSKKDYRIEEPYLRANSVLVNTITSQSSEIDFSITDIDNFGNTIGVKEKEFGATNIYTYKDGTKTQITDDAIVNFDIGLRISNLSPLIYDDKIVYVKMLRDGCVTGCTNDIYELRYKNNTIDTLVATYKNLPPIIYDDYFLSKDLFAFIKEDELGVENIHVITPNGDAKQLTFSENTRFTLHHIPESNKLVYTTPSASGGNILNVIDMDGNSQLIWDQYFGSLRYSNGYYQFIYQNKIDKIIAPWLLPTSNEVFDNTDLPTNFLISEAFPNPFNPTTQFEITSTVNGSLLEASVFDVLGRKVNTLVEKKSFSRGTHTFTLDLSGYNSGIYFVQFNSEEKNEIRKILLLK